LDYCLKVIPGETVPHDYTSMLLANYYYELGKHEQADALVNNIANQIYERLDWIASLPSDKRNNLSREMSVQQNMGMLQQIYYNCSEAKSALTESLRTNFEKYYQVLPIR
jgi:hypothetical protein